MFDDFTAIDVLWLALSAFLVVVGLALAYVLVRLAATVRRLTSFIQGLEMQALPLIQKAGGTLDLVNAQLDKVDRMTDSAVDALDGVDTAVRAATHAVTVPVQKISALAEGVRHAVGAARGGRRPREAYEAGRRAAARREQVIEEELEHGAEAP